MSRKSRQPAARMEEFTLDEFRERFGGKAAAAAGTAVEPTLTNSTNKTRVVRAKTANQQRYLEALVGCRVVFCLGMAGTGKTHVAAGAAAGALRDGRVERIICVRPAVEAGRPIGFLPGTEDDKLLPYLRPILMELGKFFAPREMIEYRRGELPVIEIQPLEFMRGLTFENSFVVVDEAQNATPEQLKMALTRLGRGTTLAINGDLTQCDLPPAQRGGLLHYSRLWPDLDQVATVEMCRDDVVRDPFLRVLMERMQDHALDAPQDREPSAPTGSDQRSAPTGSDQRSSRYGDFLSRVA